MGGAYSSFSGGVSDFDKSAGAKLERGSQFFYGLKAAVTNQDDWLAESAIIVEAGTPTSGKDTAPQFITIYIFGWELRNEWKWDTALHYGYDSAAGDHFNIWPPRRYSGCHARTIDGTSRRLWIFSKGRANDGTQHYFRPEVRYLVPPDLKVVVRFG